MLDTILRYFEGSSSLGRSIHDYFAVRSGEQRVFIEGVHGGDWLSPAGEAWYLKVPEDAVRLTQYPDSSLIHTSDLFLVGHIKNEQYISLDAILSQGPCYPIEAFCSPRSLITEDGRIFHRPDLLHQTNGNEKLLGYFVDFVLQQEGGFDKGFDQLFDKYRPFRD